MKKIIVQKFLADDTTLCMTAQEEIATALNEIEIFGSLSGLM